MRAHQLQDTKRIAAISSYHFQDASEPEYDDITALAAALFQTPFALITIVGQYRNWTLSNYGLPITPERLVFCDDHLVDPFLPLVIDDARIDDRFARNSLVASDPHIAFYAGAPIIDSDGFPLGF